MTKVLVVQENKRLDYSGAAKFGNLKISVGQHDVSSTFMGTEETFGEAFNTIRDDMECFDPESDFLVLTGNPVLIAYAAHLALDKSGCLQCLQWDNHSKSYNVIKMGDWV